MQELTKSGKSGEFCLSFNLLAVVDNWCDCFDLYYVGDLKLLFVAIRYKLSGTCHHLQWRHYIDWPLNTPSCDWHPNAWPHWFVEFHVTCHWLCIYSNHCIEMSDRQFSLLPQSLFLSSDVQCGVGRGGTAQFFCGSVSVLVAELALTVLTV